MTGNSGASSSYSRLAIDVAGNVGISSTAPQAKLHRRRTAILSRTSELDRRRSGRMVQLGGTEPGWTAGQGTQHGCGGGDGRERAFHRAGEMAARPA